MGRYSDNGDAFLFKAFFFIAFIVLWFILSPAGCTVDPDKAVKILRREGYTDIRMNGYKYFSCGKNDSFNIGFTATKSYLFWVAKRLHN